MRRPWYTGRTVKPPRPAAFSPLIIAPPMARYLLMPQQALGLPLPVEDARPEDVIGELELTEDELRAWLELVARAVIDACDRN